VGGRRARKGLRKLHPPSRAATLKGVARERRLRTETTPPPANAVSPGQGRGRRGAGVRRPTRRVKGRIGAGSLLQGARVARIAECCLEQKVGYDRHTDHPQRLKKGKLPLAKLVEGYLRAVVVLEATRRRPSPEALHRLTQLLARRVLGLEQGVSEGRLVPGYLRGDQLVVL